MMKEVLKEMPSESQRKNLKNIFEFLLNFNCWLFPGENYAKHWWQIKTGVGLGCGCGLEGLAGHYRTFLHQPCLFGWLVVPWLVYPTSKPTSQQLRTSTRIKQKLKPSYCLLDATDSFYCRPNRSNDQYFLRWTCLTRVIIQISLLPHKL